MHETCRSEKSIPAQCTDLQVLMLFLKLLIFHVSVALLKITYFPRVCGSSQNYLFSTYLWLFSKLLIFHVSVALLKSSQNYFFFTYLWLFSKLLIIHVSVTLLLKSSQNYAQFQLGDEESGLFVPSLSSCHEKATVAL